MIVRMASGLFVLVLATGCKDRSEPAPRGKPATTGSGSASTAVKPPIEALPALPIDAANLPEVTAAERAMVATWFARLNGTEPLVIKGVDVEPFRKKHAGHAIDPQTSITYAAVRKEGKRTFVVSVGDVRVYMTFDDKDQLVGISY